VLSDGDDAATSAGAAGASQTADDSTGTAQAGSQSLDAPVRVLSDGNGGTSEAAAADGGQTTAASEGAAQIGSAGAR
jgi:hypothetical protein